MVVPPPHEDDFAHARNDAGFESRRERDVRQGPDRDDRHRPRGFAHEDVDDEARGREFGRRTGRLGERRAVKTRLPVDFGRGYDLAENEGTRRPGRDRTVETAELRDAKGVRRHLLDRLVSGDRRDGENLDVGMTRRKEHGDGVVIARIAVQNDFFRHLVPFRRNVQ